MKLQSGTYRHYKGNLYEVLTTAQHSETQEWMVVYKTLYGEQSMWVRPYDMFVEKVEIEGKRVSRFEYINA